MSLPWAPLCTSPTCPLGGTVGCPWNFKCQAGQLGSECSGVRRPQIPRPVPPFSLPACRRLLSIPRLSSLAQAHLGGSVSSILYVPFPLPPLVREAVIRNPDPGSWTRSCCLRRPGSFRSAVTDLSSAGFLPNLSLVLLLSIPGKPLPEGCMTVRLLLKVPFLVP